MRYTKRAWAVFAACAVLTPVLPGPALLAQTPQPGIAPGPVRHEIVVTGRGSVSATPDRITIALVTGAVRPTLQEAQQQRDAAVAKIVHDVGALGVSQQSIETTTFVRPRRGERFSRERRSPGSRRTGYAAIGRILVTVDSPALATRVVNAAAAAGSTRVARVRAGWRDPSSYHAQALKLAVERAEADAKTIANAAGVPTPHLAQIQEVQPSVQTRRPSGRRGAWTSRADAQLRGTARPMRTRRSPVPVVPQSLPITATVRAVYTF